MCICNEGELPTLPNTLRILVTAATPEKQNSKKSLRGGGILLGRKNHFQI
ncbi:MAG: hypothetical protein ACI83L_000983 [Cryomorphaceae bacterium]|jgi:hypothetical protein